MYNYPRRVNTQDYHPRSLFRLWACSNRSQSHNLVHPVTKRLGISTHFFISCLTRVLSRFKGVISLLHLLENVVSVGVPVLEDTLNSLMYMSKSLYRASRVGEPTSNADGWYCSAIYEKKEMYFVKKEKEEKERGRSGQLPTTPRCVTMETL